ncbi:MAG: hypothetical protein RSB10_02850 [Clostridia bacterium]
MKGAKSTMGVIAIILLISVLGGTYAWYSEFMRVDFSATITLTRYTEVLLDTNTIKNIPKYNGQLGYDANGAIYTNNDAPYTAEFDTTFKVLGATNVDMYVEYDYVAIKVGPIFQLPPNEAIASVFGESASTVNVNDYLGAREEVAYDTLGIDGYYRDEMGNYRPLGAADTTIKFSAKNLAGNASKKGMIVLNVSDKVEYIVIKKAFVAEYFNMQYAYKDGNVYNAPQKIAQPMRFLYGSANKEVWDKHQECKVHTVKIMLGYYGTNANGSHRTFDFGGQAYKGSTFSFALRLHGEEARNA